MIVSLKMQAAFFIIRPHLHGLGYHRQPLPPSYPGRANFSLISFKNIARNQEQKNIKIIQYGGDVQRSVFRTMTYTMWAPQIFYLMKRKRKKDLQVNLWDFSRQSDDMMSEFWFAFFKFSRQDY